jgi:hypothetical protein
MLVNSGRRFDLGHLAHRACCGKHRDACLHPRRQREKIRTLSIDRAFAAPVRAGPGCSMFASDPRARKPPNV